MIKFWIGFALGYFIGPITFVLCYMGGYAYFSRLNQKYKSRLRDGYGK